VALFVAESHVGVGVAVDGVESFVEVLVGNSLDVDVVKTFCSVADAKT
jgi:hypothetical protein